MHNWKGVFMAIKRRTHHVTYAIFSLSTNSYSVSSKSRVGRRPPHANLAWHLLASCCRPAVHHLRKTCPKPAVWMEDTSQNLSHKSVVLVSQNKQTTHKPRSYKMITSKCFCSVFNELFFPWNFFFFFFFFNFWAALDDTCSKWSVEQQKQTQLTLLNSLC